jgi:nuclear pore complex protein Nup107
LIDQAYEQVVKLLTTEWLVSDVDIFEGTFFFVHRYILVTNQVVVTLENRRRFELIRIRQIYIPELILRLHNMLFTSRHMIPEYVRNATVHICCPSFSTPYYRNLKRALQLVNIVADSRYRLYDDFKGVGGGGRSLSDYLGVVRQAVLGGLENGGSDPFRVVTAY